MNINVIRILVFLYCAAIGFLFYSSIQPWTLDDAFISFRYAENWANGIGFVYNPGEYVEGYTSFLWVFLLACSHWIGLDTVIAAKILCLICSGINLLFVLLSHRFIPSINTNDSLIAALLLGTSGVFIPWSFSGMEVSLFCLLVTVQILYAVYTSENPSNISHLILGLISSLTILCRPEGVLVSGLVFIYLFYTNKSPFSLLYMQKLNAFFLPVVDTVMIHYCLRYWYYGEWLPNTYYVKVGWSTAQLFRGVHYVSEFIPTVLGMIMFIVMVFYVSRTVRFSKIIHLLLSVPVLFCGYCLIVGGDSMPAFRFLVPVMPFVCILAAQCINYLFTKTNHILFAVLFLVAINAHHLFNNWHIHGHILSDRVAVNGKEVGLWLKENLPPDAVIATNTAGSIAYYSELTTIDMLGLTDNHIAHRELADMGQGSAGHEKGDGAYVLSRKPDVIQFASSLGALEPMFRSGKEMVDLSEFHSNYEPRTIGLPNGKDVVLYFRN